MSRVVRVLNVQNGFKGTPLIIASYYGNVDVVRYLVQLSEVKLDMKNDSGKDSYDQACCGYTRIIHVDEDPQSFAKEKQIKTSEIQVLLKGPQ